MKTHADAVELAAMGCEEAQGYLFAWPMETHQVVYCVQQRQATPLRATTCTYNPMGAKTFAEAWQSG